VIQDSYGPFKHAYIRCLVDVDALGGTHMFCLRLPAPHYAKSSASITSASLFRQVHGNAAHTPLTRPSTNPPWCSLSLVRRPYGVAWILRCLLRPTRHAPSHRSAGNATRFPLAELQNIPKPTRQRTIITRHTPGQTILPGHRTAITNSGQGRGTRRSEDNRQSLGWAWDTAGS